MTLFDESSTDGDLFTVDGLLRPQQLPGIGPLRAVQLASRFCEWRRLELASEAELKDVIGAAAPRARAGIDDVVDPSTLLDGVRAIGRFDDEWPAWLTDIPNPPAVVFARGSLPSTGALAVVGTRSPTRFGLRVVEKVVEAADRVANVVATELLVVRPRQFALPPTDDVVDAPFGDRLPHTAALIPEHRRVRPVHLGSLIALRAAAVDRMLDEPVDQFPTHGRLLCGLELVSQRHHLAVSVQLADNERVDALSACAGGDGEVEEQTVEFRVIATGLGDVTQLDQLEGVHRSTLPSLAARLGECRGRIGAAAPFSASRVQASQGGNGGLLSSEAIG